MAFKFRYFPLRLNNVNLQRIINNCGVFENSQGVFGLNGHLVAACLQVSEGSFKISKIRVSQRFATYPFSDNIRSLAADRR